MMKLYDYLPSQNAYKVRLLLAQPGFLPTVYPYSIDPNSANELP